MKHMEPCPEQIKNGWKGKKEEKQKEQQSYLGNTEQFHLEIK